MYIMSVVARVEWAERAGPPYCTECFSQTLLAGRVPIKLALHHPLRSWQLLSTWTRLVARTERHGVSV